MEHSIIWFKNRYVPITIIFLLFQEIGHINYILIIHKKRNLIY